jgi:pyrroline-5-carboxylate reductase
MNSFSLAFIGGGNLAQALLGGVLKQDLFKPTAIAVVEPNPETRAVLEQKFGVTSYESAQAAQLNAQQLVLAVKPQVMAQVCAALAAYVSDSLVISVAAGITTQALADWLGTRRVIRTMPNTPALVGAGFTGLFALPEVNAADRTQAQQLLGAVGQTLWLENESQLDAITALSGSGPAYVFYAMEAMQRAGVELGFDAATAQSITAATFHGAVQLALQSSETPQQLRVKVTSPNGTTFAAITHMENLHVAAGIVEGIHAAALRSRELGEQLAVEKENS